MQYFDALGWQGKAGAQGWQGGYWRILDCEGMEIAGGSKAGLVSKGGGETKFMVTDACNTGGRRRVLPEPPIFSRCRGAHVTVHMRTGAHAKQLTWKITAANGSSLYHHTSFLDNSEYFQPICLMDGPSHRAVFVFDL